MIFKYSWNKSLLIQTLIVHERGNNNHNILVVEIKKSNNKSDWEIDKRKLEGFTKKRRRIWI